MLDSQFAYGALWMIAMLTHREQEFNPVEPSIYMKTLKTACFIFPTKRLYNYAEFLASVFQII